MSNDKHLVKITLKGGGEILAFLGSSSGDLMNAKDCEGLVKNFLQKWHFLDQIKGGIALVDGSEIAAIQWLENGNA
jgi:hypothetical protein